MEVIFILAADYANMTADNRLNVMGIFGKILSNSFPAVHNKMHLLIRLRPDMDDDGTERNLTIKLLDPDAEDVIRLSKPFLVPPSVNGKPMEIDFDIELNNVLFKTAGRYEFAVLIDDERKDELGIDAVIVSRPSA